VLSELIELLVGLKSWFCGIL